MKLSFFAVYTVLVDSCSIVIVAVASITPTNLPTYLQSQSCAPLNVDTITIDQTYLPTLDPSTFAGLPNLQRLNVTNAGLTSIPATIFDNLSALTTVNFARNLLTTLPSNLFSGNLAVTSAFFNNNYISSLPANVFAGAPLLLLDLSNNRLTGFVGGTFTALGELKWLYLQNNNLRSSEVHTGILDPLASLAVINVKNNSNLPTLPAQVFFAGGSLLDPMTLTGDSALVCNCVLGPPAGCVPCRGIALLTSCCYKSTPPTASPTTRQPTLPTPLPTLAPTTRNPTTKSPTTRSPTRSPTTKSPTTPQPSKEPTQQPTGTDVPTSSPTTSPSVSPTTTPTRSPITFSPSTSSPSSAQAATMETTPYVFPWEYVLGAIVFFLCLLTLYLYLRRRQQVKKNNLRARHLRGDSTAIMSMNSDGSFGSSSQHSSSPSRVFLGGSHSPSSSVDGSTNSLEHSGGKRGEHSTTRGGRDGGTMVEIEGSEVEVGPKLGNGAFGSVHQCLWRGTDYAMKSLLNPTQEVAFEKEVEINRHLSAIPHIHVTRMVGVTHAPAGIVMELYPMGSVEDYLRSNLLAPGDYPQVLTILITASAGVMHLHSQGIIHRDLAARNFLIKKDHSAAVCDFGLSLALPEGKSVGQRTPHERETDMLPINITAPESLSHGKYSIASDVYMFGMFMWEVLARQIPHCTRPEFTSHPKDFPGFIGRVVKEDLRPMVPLDWPPVLRTLILQCWDRNPANRPTLHYINSTLRTCRSEALATPTPLPPSHTKTFTIVDSNVYYADTPNPAGRNSSAYAHASPARASEVGAYASARSPNTPAKPSETPIPPSPYGSVPSRSGPYGPALRPRQLSYENALAPPPGYGSGEFYGSYSPSSSPRNSISISSLSRKRES